MPILERAWTTPAGLAWIVTDGKYQFPPHLRVLTDYLLRLTRGEITRLLVSVPPRHGKSYTISQYFPAWYLGTHPDERVILCSYQADFAATWGRKVRDILTEHGRALYGIEVSPASSAADRWDIAGHAGGMITAGAGGAITGRGANLAIVDDPIKNMEEAMSETIRERIWDWFTSTLYTRFEPKGKIVILMTRWHEDDLVGKLLDQEKNGGEHWETLTLPAVAEEDEVIRLSDGVTFKRKQDQPLWPGRYNTEELARIKTAVGSRVWSALYQQHPSPDAGLIWKREWFSQRYHELPQFRFIVQSVDSAFKTGVANDNTAIATWGATDSGFYLLNCWCGRVEFPELKHAIVDQYIVYHPNAILIEDRASGQSVIQELHRGTILPIVPWSPRGTKESRAAAVSPLGEAGKLWLPEDAPWIGDWIEEHIAFPNGAHDDKVDTTSMALEYLAYGNGSQMLSWLDAMESHTAQRITAQERKEHPFGMRN